MFNPNPIHSALAPQLFARLKLEFLNVRLSKAGMAFCAANAAAPASPNQSTWRIDDWGESYLVNCPFCADQEHRLTICHMYGQPDPMTPDRRPLKYLAKCHRRDCLRDRCNRDQLFEWIWGHRNVADRRRTLAPIRSHGYQAETTGLESRPLPADSIDMSTLPDQHPGVRYLSARGFGRAHISSFALHHSPQYFCENGCIVAPIVFDGTQVGWQARRVDGGHGTRRKYHTSAGLAKSKILYNWDVACQQPMIVVCEGITDVWRIFAQRAAHLV